MNHSSYTSAQSSEQGFDALLSDFLDLHDDSCETEDTSAAPDEERADEEDSSIPMKRCRHQGVNYWVPASSSKAVYSFSTLHMGCDYSHADLSDARPRLYLQADSRKKDAFFLLFGNVYKDSGEKDVPVRLWLYRTGEEQPLCHLCEQPSEGDWLTTFEAYAGCMTTGNYFLLMESFDLLYDEPAPATSLMGGHLRFDFRVLPNGECLTHPDILALDVEPCPAKVAWSSNKLRLRPHLSRPLGEDEELAFYCFSHRFVRMGCGVDSISADYIWMPGDYLLLAEHNGVHYAAIDLKFDGKTFKTGSARPLPAHADEKLLMELPTASFSSSSDWKQLCLTPGLGSLTRRLLLSLRKEQFNTIRRQWGLTSLNRYEHFLFTVRHHSFLNKFIHLAMDCTDIRTLDAAQWVEQTTRQYTTDTGNDVLDGCWQRAVCLYNIGVLATPEARSLLNSLLNRIETKREWSLCLCGSPAEVNSLLDTVPTLLAYIPPQNRISEEPATTIELVHYLQHRLQTLNFSLTPAAEHRLVDLFDKAVSSGSLTDWGTRELDDYLEGRLLPGLCNRVLSSHKDVARQTITTLTAKDILPPASQTDNASTFDKSMEALNRMVGLSAMKQQLYTLFNRVRFDEQRRRAGLRVEGNGLSHMVFTGNPGTGKTTVSRLLGQACKALGLLSKGEVIVTERSKLVGRYIGDTERNTLAAIESARGNVLFIDEAYTLCTQVDDNRDFGKRVIDTLLTVLADSNPDMLVVLAGYRQEMERLFATNPGLRGRFSCQLHFSDYSADELWQIAVNRLAEQDYHLTDEASTALRSVVNQAVAAKDNCFSNARWACKLVDEGILSVMADRVMSGITPVSTADLQWVQTEDVYEAARRMQPSQAKPQTKRIGFRV